MRRAMLGLIVPLMCGSALVQAADAEEFAEELGSVTVSAMPCSSSLAARIEQCLDEIIETHGFTGDDRERLLQAYKAGIAKGEQASAEENDVGCGDIVRDIRKQPFWARCPGQAKD